MRKYKIFTLKEKEEIMACYKQHGYKETFKRYKVGYNTIVYWKTRIKDAKPSDPHPLARRYLIRPKTVAFVQKLHKKYPTRTLEQLKKEVTAKCQSISITKLWHIIKEGR